VNILSEAVSVILLRPPLREMGALTAQALRLPVAGALLSMTPWARGGVVRLQAGGRGVDVADGHTRRPLPR
jgi:hypothetical protein